MNRQRSKNSDDRGEFCYEVGRQHSFSSFKKWADEFKSKWFGGKEVSPEEIEKEFWDIVEKAETHLTVEYGNDLTIAAHGSGFPISSRIKESASDSERLYMEHPWNLNVLPLLPTSLLSQLNTPRSEEHTSDLRSDSCSSDLRVFS